MPAATGLSLERLSIKAIALQVVWLMTAAIDAQSQCVVVILLAEARIGAELMQAQERRGMATQAATAMWRCGEPEGSCC